MFKSLSSPRLPRESSRSHLAAVISVLAASGASGIPQSDAHSGVPVHRVCSHTSVFSFGKQRFKTRRCPVIASRVYGLELAASCQEGSPRVAGMTSSERVQPVAPAITRRPAQAFAVSVSLNHSPLSDSLRRKSAPTQVLLFPFLF